MQFIGRLLHTLLNRQYLLHFSFSLRSCHFETVTLNIAIACFGMCMWFGTST